MKNTYLYLLLIFVLCACGRNNLEQVELTEDDGSKVTYTRNKENFAKEGTLVRFDADGVKLEKAEYKNDTLHGVRHLYYPNGNIQVSENYMNGTFEGDFKSFYENGKVQLEGIYVNNVMDGTWKGYYDSGELKEEVLFKNNNENGPFVEYHKNGKLKAKGTYLDGDNEDGLLELYDEDGELIKKMQCKKGVCRTSWTKEGGEQGTKE